MNLKVFACVTYGTMVPILYMSLLLCRHTQCACSSSLAAYGILTVFSCTISTSFWFHPCLPFSLAFSNSFSFPFLPVLSPSTSLILFQSRSLLPVLSPSTSLVFFQTRSLLPVLSPSTSLTLFFQSHPLLPLFSVSVVRTV